MPIADIEQFTYDYRALPDGSVAFRCSEDRDKWPWLELDPADPIVVQTINFWAASGASAARGTLDPTKWTALTATHWVCGEPGVGHATHGIAEGDGKDGKPGYRLTFFDTDGALVYRMTGEGVVFQNRDFESWRQDKKDKISKTAPPAAFDYAQDGAIALGAHGICFLSDQQDSETPTALGLITKENGLPPGNRYMSGSGDHVNATHLAEIGRQFASLLAGGADYRCPGGEMHFDRFVELGSPFEVALVERLDSRISLTVDQAGRRCARVMLDLA